MFNELMRMSIQTARAEARRKKRMPPPISKKEWWAGTLEYAASRSSHVKWHRGDIIVNANYFTKPEIEWWIEMHERYGE